MRKRSLGQLLIGSGLLLAGIVVGPAATPARAGEVVLSIDTFINGSTPDSSPPFITLDFKDLGTNTVELTITNKLPSSEFTDDVLFNSKVALASGDFSYVSGIPVLSPNGITFNTNGQNNIKAGVFDVNFSYTTANNSGRFNGGDTSVYDITATGLTAASFEKLSTPDSHSVGTYYAAAHIMGLPGGLSYSAGATTFTAVPEPSSLALGAIAILGMAVTRRFRRRAAV